MKKDFTYSAFISYSSKDEKVAKSLWKKLERYRLPAVLQKQYEDIPEKMHVFLDQGDIVPGDTVENALCRELADSKKLIVICSPNSAKSPYVELEVKNFLSLGHSSNDIIPYIIDGEVDRNNPNNCYVPSLFGNVDKDTINGVSVVRDGKWKAFVGVLANLLDVKFDEIYKREKVRKNRIIAAWSGFGAITACFVGLVIWYATPHTKYYMDYITRWGIPVGIYELNKKQIKQESEHYEITSRFGRPQKLVHANNQKEPVNQLHFMNHFNRPKIATYEYKNGKIPFVPMKNWNLTLAYYTINSGDLIDGDKDYTVLLEYNDNSEEEDSKIVDFYYGKGTREKKALSNNFLDNSCFLYSDVRKLIIDDNFMEQFDLYSPDLYFFNDVSTIFQFRIKYNNNGYEEHVNFYNYNGNKSYEKNKINGYRVEYDNLGRVIKQILNYESPGLSKPQMICYQYDENGHLTFLKYTDLEEKLKTNKYHNYSFYENIHDGNMQTISFYDEYKNPSDCSFLANYKIESNDIDEFTNVSKYWSLRLENTYIDCQPFEKAITNFGNNTIEHINYLVINNQEYQINYIYEKELNENKTEIYSEDFNLETGEKSVQSSITEIEYIDGMRIEKNTVNDTENSNLGTLNYSMCYDSHERLISEKINQIDGLLECFIEYKGENRSVAFFKNSKPYFYPLFKYSQANFVYNNNNQLIACDFKDVDNHFVLSYLQFSKYEAKYNSYGLKIKDVFLSPKDIPVYSNMLGYSQYVADDSFNHKYLISFKYIDEKGNYVIPNTDAYSHMVSEINENNRESIYYKIDKIHHREYFENDELIKAGYYGYKDDGSWDILFHDNLGRYLEGIVYDKNGNVISRKHVEYTNDCRIVSDYFDYDIIDSVMIDYNSGESIYEKYYTNGSLKYRLTQDSSKRIICREEYDDTKLLINKTEYDYSKSDYCLANTKSYDKNGLISHGYFYESNDIKPHLINGPDGYCGIKYFFDDKKILRKLVKKVSNGDISGIYSLSGDYVSVFEIFEGSQAEKNGLKKDDIFLEFNEFNFFLEGTESDFKNEIEKGKKVRKNIVIYRPSDKMFYKMEFTPGVNGFGYEPKFAGNSIEESEKNIEELKIKYMKWKDMNN